MARLHPSPAQIPHSLIFKWLLNDAEQKRRESQNTADKQYMEKIAAEAETRRQQQLALEQKEQRRLKTYRDFMKANEREIHAVLRSIYKLLDVDSIYRYNSRITKGVGSITVNLYMQSILNSNSNMSIIINPKKTFFSFLH